MHKASARLLTGLLLVAAVALLVSGCGSPASSAQKLFDRGEYQAVIDKYPDLEIARRARAKLAENLLAERKFDAVLREYSDTPAAYKARMEMAQQMFNEGKYQTLLDSFPASPLAATAKQRLADSLLTAGDKDQLLVRFPDTPQALTVKQERATVELAAAKRMRGDEKTKALEKIARDYAGTDGAREANEVLAKIRSEQYKKAR